MEALKALFAIVKNNAWKAVAVFVLGGLSAVLGIVPGTEQVSNVVGNQINSVKASIGTSVSPTVQ